MDIKEMLRFLLKLGLTEEAIALAINVNQSTISRILSGRIHDPKGSVVSSIRNLFENEMLKS